MIRFLCSKNGLHDVRGYIPSTMIESIRLFASAGKGRETNDENNKLREKILLILAYPPEHFLNDNEYGREWYELSQKWNTFLKTLCPTDFTDVQLVEKGKRKFKYDFDIKYLRNSELVHTVKGEFKHNVKSLSDLPQYLDVREDKPYIDVRYSEYFYDKYIQRLCDLVSLEKPTKDSYLKYVYQNKCNQIDFFNMLKNSETTFYKQKQQLVHESIRTYLDLYANRICLDTVTRDILVQKEKTFILWDCNQFRADTIQEDELLLTHVERIKNNNTIVAVSKAGTKHEILLRWKNHLGVLLPAWRFSLDRSARQSPILS